MSADDFPRVNPRTQQVALAKSDLTMYLLQTLATQYGLTQNEIMYILTDVASTTAQYAIRGERDAEEARRARKAKKK